MATVSMFLSPRDSTLSVNSGGGESFSLEKWLGCVCLTVQTGVTVATACPSAKQRGSRPQHPREPRFPLLLVAELNTE